MKTEELVEKFNRKFPVGATVGWRSIGKETVAFRDYTVRSPAIAQNGQAVAWLNERSGMVSVEEQFVDYDKGN